MRAQTSVRAVFGAGCFNVARRGDAAAAPPQRPPHRLSALLCFCLRAVHAAAAAHALADAAHPRALQAAADEAGAARRRWLLAVRILLLSSERSHRL
eukprot:5658074-Pleurochrysis_carterae.AAC.1